jgi:lipopolysaccharide transport system ATP-binding protein
MDESFEAVRVEEVSKSFPLQTVSGHHGTLKNLLTSLSPFTRSSGPTHQALDRVTFSVSTGEAVGIVGRNGSGKSTLLRLLAGIYRPDSGQILTRGRISSLIELGAGFHQDITGRENILVEGMLLGLSRREVRRRLDEIVSFAEIGEYLDQPVRTYSTGMFMRLAFSIATHVDPDILLIDEVLAVGDGAFVLKCYERLMEFRAGGKCIILVSHDTASVERWCDRAIWIEKGRLAAEGHPGDVIAQYLGQHAGTPTPLT